MAPPILLVEDDIALAQTMAYAIENVGVPVEHCATADTAIDLLREKYYAVIVVDLVLEEGASGIYVINALRSVPPDQRPLVLMTTGASLEMLRGVDRSLVAAVMLKPIDFELFAEYVLATYRRAIGMAGEVASQPSLSPAVKTFCGGCGAEITPWVFDPPHPADPSDTFQLWLETPCSRCGAFPDDGACRSHWQPRRRSRVSV